MHGLPLVIVMGHERCGAIKAMVDGLQVHGHLQTILDSLQNEKEIKAIANSDKERLEHCMLANIRHGIAQLSGQSKIIAEKLYSHLLKIVGLRYDLDNRRVSIVH